jgi:hypothetical protein
MVLPTALKSKRLGTVIAASCNDLFECWEVTRSYPAEGHLSRFTNRAEGILTTLTT